MAQLELFSYYRSSAAFRVRIALNWKRLPYTYRAVHLLDDGGKQHSPEYRQINPLGEVPCLVDDGFALGQSMAIFHYLEDTHPEPALFPKEAKAKARVIQLCEAVNSGIHPLQNLKVLQELARRYGIDQAGKDDWVQHWIHLGLDSLEKLLTSCAGRYAYGDSPTAADMFIVPQTFTAKRFHCDLTPFARVRAIAEECLKLEAFKRAEPSCQPDTPPAS